LRLTTHLPDTQKQRTRSTSKSAVYSVENRDPNSKQNKRTVGLRRQASSTQSAFPSLSKKSTNHLTTHPTDLALLKNIFLKDKPTAARYLEKAF